MFPTSRIVAAALAALVTCTATAAEARQFYGSRGIHGPNGRGVTRTVDITRGGGQRVETRSLQTDRGRGILYLHVVGVRDAADVEKQREGVLRWERRLVRALGSRAQYAQLKADQRAGTLGVAYADRAAKEGAE